MMNHTTTPNTVLLQDDPLFGQTITGSDGVERDFKPLSRTLEQLELGFGPMYALEQQQDRSKSIISLYYSPRLEMREEHRRSECGWTCEGSPHPAAAIICRICKNRAGIYTQTGAIGVLDARNHFLICRGLSDAQRSTFRAALWKVDLDFVKKEVDNGAKFRHLKSLLEPVDTSSIPLPNFRHKKFTALSSESLDQEEALRTLRADGRLVQWRSRAPSTVDGDAPTAQQDDLTVLRYSIEEEETDEGASISDDRGSSHQGLDTDLHIALQALDFRKASDVNVEVDVGPPRHKPGLIDHEVSEEATSALAVRQQQLADSGLIQKGPKKNKKQKKEKKETKTKRKPKHMPKHVKRQQDRNDARYMLREDALKLSCASSTERYYTSKALASISQTARAASLEDFTGLLRAANIYNLDHLRAKLDRRRVPKFVGYLADTFPEHIDAHLTRFNLIEALDRFLQDI